MNWNIDLEQQRERRMNEPGNSEKLAKNQQWSIEFVFNFNSQAINRFSYEQQISFHHEFFLLLVWCDERSQDLESFFPYSRFFPANVQSHVNIENEWTCWLHLSGDDTMNYRIMLFTSRNFTSLCSSLCTARMHPHVHRAQIPSLRPWPTTKEKSVDHGDEKKVCSIHQHRKDFPTPLERRRGKKEKKFVERPRRRQQRRKARLVSLGTASDDKYAALQTVNTTLFPWSWRDEGNWVELKLFRHWRAFYIDKSDLFNYLNCHGLSNAPRFYCCFIACWVVDIITEIFIWCLLRSLSQEKVFAKGNLVGGFFAQKYFWEQSSN